MWQGEPFYENRPVSYWSVIIREYEAESALVGRGQWKPPSRTRSWTDFIGLTRSVGLKNPPHVLGDDPAAYPVLIALLDDPFPEVRGTVLSAFLQRGEHPDRIIPVMIQFLVNENVEENRLRAYKAIAMYGSEGHRVLSKLLDQVRNEAGSQSIEERQQIEKALTTIVKEYN
jgi:hypothetical protein